MCFCLKPSWPAGTFQAETVSARTRSEGFVEQRRAEMTAPRNVLSADFCLRKHLIPGRHILISIQVLGEAGRREADYRDPEGGAQVGPADVKGRPGHSSEATICCLGGRGGGWRAEHCSRALKLLPHARASAGPPLSGDPTRGSRSESGDVYT